MASQLRKDLRWSSREGATCCVMLGAGESSLASFVLAAGHSGVACGLITTVPLFFGALLQNLAPWALKRVGSVRTWSVGMAGLQGFCLLLLSLSALTSGLPLWGIFTLVSLYWAAGWSVGPAWNTWMDSVIPGRLRARFFSRRNAFCLLIQWMTMMAASVVLYWGQQQELVLLVFAGLFALAGAARLYSASCMARQSEPVRLPANYRVLGIRESFSHIRSVPKARPLFYMLGAQFSMALAAPFLVPYLTHVRGISYAGGLVCIAAAIFSRALVLPRLGTLAHRVGPVRLFRASGLGLAVVPCLWLLPGLGFVGFLVLQVLAGAFLAAYEMAVTLVYLEAVPVASRTSVLTRFSIFNTLAMLLGSSLGATLLLSLGSGAGAYALLFVTACLARLCALKLLRGQASDAASGTFESHFSPSSVHHVIDHRLLGGSRAPAKPLTRQAAGKTSISPRE